MFFQSKSFDINDDVRSHYWHYLSSYGLFYYAERGILSIVGVRRV